MINLRPNDNCVALHGPPALVQGHGHSGTIRRVFLGETGSWARVTSGPSAASCSKAPSANGGSSLRRRRRRSATRRPPGPEMRHDRGIGSGDLERGAVVVWLVFAPSTTIK